MPRVARLFVPNSFHHVTANVASGEYRLEDPAVKREYLRRLTAAIRRGDYELLSYVLMDNHVHIGLEAGSEPVARLMQSLQGAFADWLNKRQGRSGHLWRGRYHEVVGTDPPSAVHFITYHHNNPVRASMVDTAADSAWSSHRAYCRMAPRPAELNVERGLELCGLSDTADGRRAFDQLTFDRLFAGKCEWMTEEWMMRVRARTRAAVGCPIEVGQPVVRVAPGDGAGGTKRLTAAAPIVVALDTAASHRLEPGIDDVVRAVALRCSADEASIRCRGGGRRSQRLRRIVIWAWSRVIGGRPVDVARALNRSDAAVAQIARRMEADHFGEERRIAADVAEGLGDGLDFGRLALKPSER